MTADDLAGCAEVARSIAIPVATGENNYTRFEFRELIERRAARTATSPSPTGPATASPSFPGPSRNTGSSRNAANYSSSASRSRMR